jgi:hypothetical protein
VHSFIYFIVEQYPFWGIPMAIIFIEVALHFRRTGHRLRAVVLFLVSAGLLGLAAYFILENGVQNVRPAMQKIENKYLD